MECVNKCWVDYAIAIGPSIVTACIAGFVAWVAYQQWRTNSEKLRLDLYNRRFDVYAKMLTFFQALVGYDPIDHKESFRDARADFVRVCREATFLFDKESGIEGNLNEMLSDSYKVSGFRESRRELATSGDPENYAKLEREALDIAFKFGIRIDNLEKAMAPYLNFHKINV